MIEGLIEAFGSLLKKLLNATESTLECAQLISLKGAPNWIRPIEKYVYLTLCSARLKMG